MKAPISIFLSFLAVKAVWLGFPALILALIAAIFGLAYYREEIRHQAHASGFRKYLNLAPATIALGSFGWILWLMNSGYKA